MTDISEADIAIIVGQKVRDVVASISIRAPLTKIIVYCKDASTCDAPAGIQKHSSLPMLREGILQVIGLPFRTMFMFNADKTFTAEESKAVQDIAEQTIETKMTSWNTLGQFGFTWQRNALLNIASIAKEPCAQDYLGAAVGCDAVIVGAGPSLDRHLAQLKEIQERCVIIAAARSVKTLQAAGVDPHIVMSVESQDVSGHFNGADLSQCVVGLAAVSPRAVVDQTRHTGRRFWFSANSRMDDWSFRACGKEGRLRTGGSVTTAALSMAACIGASRLILVGCDFAYDGNKIYSGAYNDEIVKRPSDGLWVYPFYKDKTLDEHQPLPIVEVPGYVGPVLTHKSWAQCREWFEAMFESLPPEVQAINASGSGSTYKHCINTSLETMSFIKTVSRQDILKITTERAARRQSEKSAREYLASLRNVVTHAINDAKQYSLIADSDRPLAEKIDMLEASEEYIRRKTLDNGYLYAMGSRWLFSRLTEAADARSVADFAKANTRYATLCASILESSMPLLRMSEGRI